MTPPRHTERWLTWAVIEVRSGRRTLGEVARRLRRVGEQSRAAREPRLTAAQVDAIMAVARARRLAQRRAA